MILLSYMSKNKQLHRSFSTGALLSFLLVAALAVSGCYVVEFETIGERTDGSPAELTVNSKYIVIMFRSSTFTGEVKSSAEDKMEWMTHDEMYMGGHAPNMEKYIRVLLEDNVLQVIRHQWQQEIGEHTITKGPRHRWT